MKISEKHEREARTLPAANPFAQLPVKGVRIVRDVLANRIEDLKFQRACFLDQHKPTPEALVQELAKVEAAFQQCDTLLPEMVYAETIGAYLLIKEGALWQIPANTDGSPGRPEEASLWMRPDKDDRYVRQNVEDALELLGSDLFFDCLPQCI